jgi:exopolyphosphatase/guanosine-5'-triphosphate,3'-diphosphate pyrophosphatase
MIKKIGAIDVGTNTFHLLIVNWNTESHQFEEIIRKRFFVKLGATNLYSIDKEAFNRGINAMINFKKILLEHNVNEVKAYGTSAIRNADNANQFILDVKNKTGINIQKISGDKEAELILKGTKLSIIFDAQPVLIMDIGGGSVEFIIANKDELFYAKSFKVGVAVLKKLFHQSEPIDSQQIKKLKQYLKTELQSLMDKIHELKPDCLIGASGTFDVLAAALPNEKISSSAHILDTRTLPSFIENITSKTLAERKVLDTIPESRADFIGVGLLLIDFVWNLADFKKLVVTKYSMKEGILQEMMETANP